MKSILILFIVILTGCTSTSETNKVTESSITTTQQKTSIMPTVSILDAADFKAKIESLKGVAFHLIDVRTENEVARGTIESSVNIDYMNSEFSNNLAKLDKEKPLLLFCQAGGRSGKASLIAKELGFIEIYDLKGGYSHWSN